MKKVHGEIVAVRDLFEKYHKTLQAPQKTVELEAIRVIGELVHITLKEHQVIYTPNSRILAIKVPSIIKQEVMLKRDDVLLELKQRMGGKNAPQTLL